MAMEREHTSKTRTQGADEKFLFVLLLKKKKRERTLPCRWRASLNSMKIGKKDWKELVHVANEASEWILLQLLD